MRNFFNNGQKLKLLVSDKISNKILDWIYLQSIFAYSIQKPSRWPYCIVYWAPLEMAQIAKEFVL